MLGWRPQLDFRAGIARMLDDLAQGHEAMSSLDVATGLPPEKSMIAI
jgi:hypothetical protein